MNEQFADLSWSNDGSGLSVNVSYNQAHICEEDENREGDTHPVLSLDVYSTRALIDMLTMALHMLERREKEKHEECVGARLYGIEITAGSAVDHVRELQETIKRRG